MQIDNDKVINYALGNGDCFYLLYNYKTLGYFDINKLTELIIKEDSKANGKIGMNFGNSLASGKCDNNGVVEKAILKKQDLIYRTKTYKKLSKQYKERVRKVIKIITSFDKDIGYVLKRYFIDDEKCTYRILMAEMYYSETKIKTLKKKGLQLYEKYYNMLYVNRIKL